jgi:hypothetical protein
MEVKRVNHWTYFLAPDGSVSFYNNNNNTGLMSAGQEVRISRARYFRSPLQDHRPGERARTDAGVFSGSVLTQSASGQNRQSNLHNCSPQSSRSRPAVS